MGASALPDKLVIAGLFACLRLLACILLLASPMAAAEPQALRVDGSQSAISLQPYIRYLRDPTGSLQIEQVVQQVEQFLPASERRDLNFGYTHDHLWLSLDLLSTADQLSDWLIEMSYASLDRVSLYSVGADGIQVQHSGDTLAYDERSIGHRNPVFALRLAPGEQRRLFIRAHSAGSLTLDSQLWTAAGFQQYSQKGYVLLALYFGALLALASYNLLLFAVLRERSFILYVSFVVSFGVGVLAINGLGAQYLWPNLGTLGNRLLPFGISLAATLGVLFAQAFLCTARRAPRLDRYLCAWAGLAALATLATLLIEVQRALQLMSSVGLITTVLLLGSGLICVVKRVPGARIFVLAWLALLVGGSLLALRNFALIPSNFITVNAMQIGSAMEMLLLSLGLAARFNQLKRLQEEAQKQALAAALQQERVLEQRVAERTEALAEANARLEAQTMQDPLTGLANRTALASHMQQTMLRARRRGELLALVLIDLDGFKDINDEWGHAVGDRVLIEVGARLQAFVRGSDLVARLGGDEFILLSEGIHSRQQVLELAERLLHVISLPMALQHQTVSVGASIGISFSDGIAPDIETLMRQADQAMYQRKRSGKQGVVLYSA
jgi:diguanylate cyclase (GGDEF)-like protein